jgi:CHAT domain-containing protein
MDLTWANAEVAAVSALDQWSNTVVVAHESAVCTRVLAEAAGADYLHFACHGKGHLNDAAQASLLLADGELTVEHLSKQLAHDGRLVVASACESGRYGIWSTTNEYVGLPSAFIGAGFACVVASLWKVSDLATCLLVTRFYELLWSFEENGLIPPGIPSAALQSAQYDSRTSLHSQSSAHPLSSGDSTT